MATTARRHLCAAVTGSVRVLRRFVLEPGPRAPE